MRISEKDTNFGFGFPSMILIVVVLAMLLFALLGLRSAQAGKKLADKTAESVKRYYALETLAEERVAAVDAVVNGGGDRRTILGVKGMKDVTSLEERKNAAGENSYLVTMYVKAYETDDMAISVLAEFFENGKSPDIREWKYVKEEPEGGYELMIPD